MQPIFLHIDMNSYFATVAQQDDPSLRGRPVGVCEHLGGIIIAPSIEAKKLGVKTAMPVWEARVLCPDIVLVKTSPDRYRFFTDKFTRICERYTKHVELYSIDEVFLDVTEVVNIRVFEDGEWKLADPFEEGRKIAQEIKDRVRSEVGEWLSCSAGVSFSKLCAKLGSDMQKPDGLVVLRESDKEWMYEKLQLTDIPGIASRMEKRLSEKRIFTLKDLRDTPKSHLVAWFGVPGAHLYSMGQLQGSFQDVVVSEVVKHKSMGHQYTIPKEFRKHGVVFKVMARLTANLGRRLRVAELVATEIFVHFHTLQNDCVKFAGRLPLATHDDRILLKHVRLFLQVACQKAKVSPQDPAISVGVTCSGLCPYTGQLSLFDEDNRHQALNQTIDKVYYKHGKGKLDVATAGLADDVIADSVGFGRVKERAAWGKRGYK